MSLEHLAGLSMIGGWWGAPPLTFRIPWYALDCRPDDARPAHGLLVCTSPFRAEVPLPPLQDLPSVLHIVLGIAVNPAGQVGFGIVLPKPDGSGLDVRLCAGGVLPIQGVLRSEALSFYMEVGLRVAAAWPAWDLDAVTCPALGLHVSRATLGVASSAPDLEA